MKLVKPLTRAGHGALAGEYDRLLRVERPRVVQGIADAAAEGDRSENAEYIYGKKRLRELDRRLQYLSRLLKDAQVIDVERLSGDEVCFGCTVELEDEDGTRQKWRIVGEGEADAREGTISWKAPVAAAVLGKRVGDVVSVVRPAGEVELEVVGITFGGA
jgi:transcription elongation factor GreB